MSIADLKNRLQKAVKNVHIEILKDSDISLVENYLDGPSYDINRIITGSLFKGFPEKSVTCLVAPESVGKSSIMCLSAADAQRHGYTPILIDCEGSWTNEFCSRWGLDLSNCIYINTIFVEDITTLLGDIIDKQDKKLFLVIDSIGAMESRKLIDDTTGKDHEAKADQGGLAKKLKRMLKMFVHIVKSQNGMGMFAAHWFGSPNQYGNAQEVGGGKYIKYCPDFLIAMKKESIVDNPNAPKKDQVVLGTAIKACTMKNRFYPPFQEAVVEIDYKNGINKFAGIVDMAMTCGIINKGGAWYTLPDGSKVQGMDKVESYIKDNPDSILKELEYILSKTGYSSVNAEVAELLKSSNDDDGEE